MWEASEASASSFGSTTMWSVTDPALTVAEDVHVDEERCRGRLRVGAHWEKDQEMYPPGGTTRVPNILTIKSWRDPRHPQIGLAISLCRRRMIHMVQQIAAEHRSQHFWPGSL